MAQQNASTRGTLAFAGNQTVAEDIETYLEVVRQVRTDHSEDSTIVAGLDEIEIKLQALRVSTEPEETLREKLEALMQVPIAADRTLRLDAFRRSAARSRLSSVEDYAEQVQRMVRNTRNNIALLLLGAPEDGILKRFLKDLDELDLNDAQALRVRMATMSQSPQLWHYNERKKAFLADWLRPYQADLAKPIEEMSEEEFQTALKQVEQLREQRLEELTSLTVEKDREPFRPFNRTMDPVMNGRDEAFWGSAEARDEFVHFINLLIMRFSFSLEERFLVFRTRDGGFVYLVGVPDEAFADATLDAEGRLRLFPHLKVLVKSGERYAEITLESYNRNRKAYYSTLRTAAVPFLTAASVMVETPLSEDIRAAFDMWV